MSILKTALLTAAVMMFAGSAFAQNQIQITGIAANGSGCRAGSVTGLINGDTATLLFSGYVVNTTQQTPIQTRSCNVAVGLNIPTGLSVIATAATYMGTMALDTRRGARGFLRTTAGFSNGAMTGSTTVFTQQFKNIAVTDVIRAVAFEACTRNQTIARTNTSLTVMGSGSGEIQSLDVATFSQVLLSLRRSQARC
jgi:hypothetical protein